MSLYFIFWGNSVDKYGKYKYEVKKNPAFTCLLLMQLNAPIGDKNMANQYYWGLQIYKLHVFEELRSKHCSGHVTSYSQ